MDPIHESIEKGAFLLEVRAQSIKEVCDAALVVHLAMGASLLVLDYLKLVPMAILYGLFLYMGVMSIRGKEFFARTDHLNSDPNPGPAPHA